MRLFAALGCSVQPSVARLTLTVLAHQLKSGGALRAQAAQDRAVPTVSNHTSLRRAPDDLQGSIARAALWLPCAQACGMAPHSIADVPVLEEWHVSDDPRKRPKACGVKGCASQLVTVRHLQARLCTAHITRLAVLRGGVLQRWCGNCKCFHTLEAFSASARCAPAS